jgi:trimeric autotransporter adhesin
MKKLVFAVCSFILAAAPTQASQLFFDNFNNYTGNLTNQGPWLQTGSAPATPNVIQVIAGRVHLASSGQDANAAFPGGTFSLVDNTTFYYGATINLSAAQANGDYFLHVGTVPTDTFNFYGRIFAKSSGSGFVLGYMEFSGGSPANTPTYGATELTFGQDYRVVVAYNVVPGPLNDTASVYVNPTDLLVQGNNSSYLIDTFWGGNAETNIFGTINLRQGTAANAATLDIDNLSVGTTFADVAVVPEPSTIALTGLGLVGLSLIRRRK